MPPSGTQRRLSMKDALGAVQSILVLGGGSDIAQATVDELAKGRLRRAVLAARRPESLGPAVERARKAGVTDVSTLAFDALDAASHQAVIDEAFAGGDIDVVLVAFGVLGDQTDLDDDPVAAAELVAVNMGGAVSSISAAAKAMRAQGHGTIVVLSSVAGVRVRKDNAVYGATKRGLDGFALGLGDRLAGTGVEVMVVRPGFVHTKMTEGREVAPFSTTPEAVAADIAQGLAKGSAVVWSPARLAAVFGVLRHLPRPLWRIVSNR